MEPSFQVTRSLLLSSSYLKREHLELFENLRLMGDGTVESIEVKSGLPFRLTYEQRI